MAKNESKNVKNGRKITEKFINTVFIMLYYNKKTNISLYFERNGHFLYHVFFFFNISPDRQRFVLTFKQ